MQRLKFKRIGLKLNPPLLLCLQEGRYEAEEHKEWTQIEKNAGFYPQEGKPSEEPWDVEEGTGAMKEMHIDDRLAQRMSNNFSRGVMMMLINRYIIRVLMPSSIFRIISFSHLFTIFVILCLVRG